MKVFVKVFVFVILDILTVCCGDFVGDRIIVELNYEFTDQDLANFIAARPAILKTLRKLEFPDKSQYLLTLNKEQCLDNPQCVDQVIEDLRNSDEVKSAIKNGNINIDDIQRTTRTRRDTWNELLSNKEKLSIQRRNEDPEISDIWYMDEQIKYNHNIQKAWAAGFTGKGVNIAIVDDYIELNHTDLTLNINRTLSYDYNEDQCDPTPTDEDETHGTAVAGVVAATKGNNFCTVGVAYDATLAGIGAIGSGLSDFQLNEAFSHRSEDVDIYCAAWALSNTGDYAILSTDSMDTYGELGRNGKGSIYVLAAGNGGGQSNSNAWTLGTNPNTIVVGSVDGPYVAEYSSYGTNIMTAAYGGGLFNRRMTSTEPFDDCSDDNYAGTSYSAAVVTGIVGLALEANPTLTARDVSYLVVISSVPHPFQDPFDSTEYTLTGAKQKYHPRLGFGLLDADKMVRNARNWKNVDPKMECESGFGTNKKVSGSVSEKETVKVDRSCDVRFLENVLVTVNFNYTAFRGTVELELESPSKTKLLFNNRRPSDSSVAEEEGTLEWTYRIVGFWGEKARGKWKLRHRSTNLNVQVVINSWKLKLTGTKKKQKMRSVG